jgi:hypothetical protein
MFAYDSHIIISCWSFSKKNAQILHCLTSKKLIALNFTEGASVSYSLLCFFETEVKTPNLCIKMMHTSFMYLLQHKVESKVTIWSSH